MKKRIGLAVATASLVLGMLGAAPAAAFDNRGLTCQWNIHFRSIVGMTCSGSLRHITPVARVAVWR